MRALIHMQVVCERGAAAQRLDRTVCDGGQFSVLGECAGNSRLVGRIPLDIGRYGQVVIDTTEGLRLAKHGVARVVVVTPQRRRILLNKHGLVDGRDVSNRLPIDLAIGCGVRCGRKGF